MSTNSPLNEPSNQPSFLPTEVAATFSPTAFYLSETGMEDFKLHRLLNISTTTPAILFGFVGISIYLIEILKKRYNLIHNDILVVAESKTNNSPL